MQSSEATGEFLGIAKVSRHALKRLKSAVESKLPHEKLTQEYFEASFQKLVDDGVDVLGLDISGKKWVDIDFPEDFSYANKVVL